VFATPGALISMLAGVKVTPMGVLTPPQGTLVTSVVDRALEQICPWPVLPFIKVVQGVDGVPMAFLVSHTSADCSAVTAACKARCFSRMLPAIFSWMPKLRNMLSAMMVTTNSSSKLVTSTMPC
jgi:hypothetical protein